MGALVNDESIKSGSYGVDGAGACAEGGAEPPSPTRHEVGPPKQHVADDRLPQKRLSKIHGIFDEKPFLRSMPILGTEMCERLAYYGFATNMTVYLTQKMGYTNSTASSKMSQWSGTCYATPVVGALIADTFAGRYWTIFVFGLVYVVGTLGLPLSAGVDSLHPSNGEQPTSRQSSFFWAFMYLIALGTGGIKPIVSVFGAQSFNEHDPKQRAMISSYYNWFYAVINIGAVGATLGLVVIQTDVSYTLGYAIPCVAMFIAWAIFVAFTPLYHHMPPGGSPIVRWFRSLIAAFVHWHREVPEDKSELYEVPGFWSAIPGQEKMACSPGLSFLDKAAVAYPGEVVDVYEDEEDPASGSTELVASRQSGEASDSDLGKGVGDGDAPAADALGFAAGSKLDGAQDAAADASAAAAPPEGPRRLTVRRQVRKSRWLVTVTEVEELKCVLRLLPIFVILSFYNSIYGLMSTLFVIQGSAMDRYLGSWAVPAAVVSVLDCLSVLCWVPIYDLFLVPFFEKRGKPITRLMRMGIGFGVAVLSMIAAAVVEYMRLQVVYRHNLQDVDPTDNSVHMSVWWQIPQYALVGCSEVFAMIGGLEFFYSQSPECMRSSAQALNLLATAAGNYLDTAFFKIIGDITTRGGRPGWIADNVNQGHLDYVFYVFAVVMTIGIVVYVWPICRYYQYRQEAFDEEQVAPEDLSGSDTDDEKTARVLPGSRISAQAQQGFAVTTAAADPTRGLHRLSHVPVSHAMDVAPQEFIR